MAWEGSDPRFSSPSRYEKNCACEKGQLGPARGYRPKLGTALKATEAAAAVYSKALLSRKMARDEARARPSPRPAPHLEPDRRAGVVPERIQQLDRSFQ